MTEQPSEDFGLHVKCKRCGAEETFDFGRWATRIVGAIDCICPACGNRMTYVGVFGQKLGDIRLAADIERVRNAGGRPECEKQEAGDAERHDARGGLEPGLCDPDRSRG